MKGQVMQILFTLIIIVIVQYSCTSNNYLPGFDFNQFKSSPVEKLAKAVEKEDLVQIEAILKDTTIKVDFHEQNSEIHF